MPRRRKGRSPVGPQPWSLLLDLVVGVASLAPTALYGLDDLDLLDHVAEVDDALVAGEVLALLLVGAVMVPGLG
jgi:hypothetical protein